MANKDATDYHCKDALEICKQLGTDNERGLTASQVEQKRREYGENKLPEPKRASKFKISNNLIFLTYYFDPAYMFLRQLLDFMVIILIISAGVSAAFQDYKAAIVLIIVVVINIAIGFTQELKAELALADLLSGRLNEMDTNVTRDGHVTSLKSSELVVGDLVNLEEGDQVTADIRLIHVSHLQIDESTLTGESVPVDKTGDVIEGANTPLADRKNMAYMMTMVARGRGSGVVVRTGINTEVGKSSESMQQDQKRKKTNLQQKLAKLGKWLVLLAVVLCGIVTGLGLKNGADLKQMVETGVSLAVSVIPEGLVAVTTVTMAIGVQRMAKKKAIVRQLPAVEVLGAVSIICSDKTGTLTEGKMKAEQIWIGGNSYYISGSGIKPLGALYSDKEHKQRIDKAPNGLDKSLEDEEDEQEDEVGNDSHVIDIHNTEKDHLIPKERKPSIAGRQSNTGRRQSNVGRKLSTASSIQRMKSPAASSSSARRQSTASNRRTSVSSSSSSSSSSSYNGNGNGNGNRRQSTYTSFGSLRRLSMSRRASVNEARDKDQGWKTVGTPTEVALQVAAMKAGYGKAELEDQGWDFIQEIPFDSERKMMSVVYKSPQGVSFAFSKGAAEYLVSNCTRFAKGDEEVQLTQAEKDSIEQQILQLSEMGMRVLALAYHKCEGGTEAEESAIEKDMCFLGLIGLMDPPRKQVGPSIKQCHNAGIKVVMITGDNAITALSIAKHLNLISPDDDKDVYMKTGAQVDAMSDEDLAALEPFPTVFARVSPEVKLRIVKALQKRDKIVAFIGDGVNDAASIKRADVGVAMGITGTDVSQQSADIILSDDNFKHIVTAVEEGRCTYDNIIADVPPSLSLGIEPVEHDAMQKKPRDPHTPFFGKLDAVVVALQGLSMSLICGLVFLYALHMEHMDLVHARCLVFTMLVVIQLWHSFLSKSFTKSVFTTGLISNYWLIGAFALSFACMIGGAYIPGLNTTLDLLPLDYIDWAKIAVGVLIHSVIVELMKIVVRLKKRRDEKRAEERADNLVA